MAEINAFLTGLYARSESLSKATQDHDRGRVSAEQLTQQRQSDQDQLVELQKSAHLTYLSDGLLNWQDLFRPFLEIVQGLEAGPLVRFFDNNTFYRQPVVAAPLHLRRENLETWLSQYFQTNARGAWKASLPSPYFFAQVAHDTAYRDKPKLIEAFTEIVLTPIAEQLAARGVKFLQLQEPWLVTCNSVDAAPADWRALEKAIGTLGKNIKKKNLVLGLHTYFGDAAPALGPLLELDIDAVGIDFCETDLENLRSFDFAEKELICGCLDARNSWVEDEAIIVKFVERVQETLAPRVLSLSTNADLEFVPEPVARRKVQLLGRVAAQFSSK
ncbi:hypothetical protein HYR54_16945 [Candidatus Acetothermia bacterium]|nr:hypothetical protein [Candidatus Acetothermia bacterium]MBI3459585.1 hypothetical protein [Candidatus Acetothermia bacterium]MBI3659845.1 hypothetical protein [Candidatus Acetothermia bacterium]